MNKVWVSLILIAAVATSCEQDTQVDILSDQGHFLEGAWLNVEYGYSPGGGYYTVPVSTVPPKVIRFSEDGQITSNVEGLQQYNFYRVLDVPDSEQPVVAFFVKNPGVPNPPVTAAGVSYTIVWENGKLKLFNRWCIEGCHLGFLKLESGGE